MSELQRPDLMRKRPVPPYIKFVLLIAVVMGFSVRSCWQDDKKNYLITDNVSCEVNTPVSVDVLFDLENNSVRHGDELFMIEVQGHNEEIIAHRLVKIFLRPHSKKRYRKVIEINFTRPIGKDEKVSASIKIYKSGFLK